MENSKEYLNQFETNLNKSLAKYLTQKEAVDKILPDTYDIESKWQQICMAYLPDGVREFTHYPTVSLGWMMYIGIAMAWMWDVDWEKYAKDDEIYQHLRDARGYDNLDDYICEDLLKLDKEQTEKMAKLVGDTAEMVYNTLIHENFEAGTPEAFNAYVRCLHELYYFGAAVELKNLGYHMTPLSQVNMN